MADNKITFDISLDGIQDAEQSITSIGKAASKASETAQSAFNGAEESIAKIVARSRQASDAEIFLGQSIAKSAKTAQAEFDVLNKSISEIAGQSRNAEQSVSSIGNGADKARMSISQLAGQSQQAIGVLNRLGGINPVFSDAAVSITQVNSAMRATALAARGLNLAAVFSPLGIASAALGGILVTWKQIASAEKAHEETIKSINDKYAERLRINNELLGNTRTNEEKDIIESEKTLAEVNDAISAQIKKMEDGRKSLFSGDSLFLYNQKDLDQLSDLYTKQSELEDRINKTKERNRKNLRDKELEYAMRVGERDLEYEQSLSDVAQQRIARIGAEITLREKLAETAQKQWETEKRLADEEERRISELQKRSIAELTSSPEGILQGIIDRENKNAELYAGLTKALEDYRAGNDVDPAVVRAMQSNIDALKVNIADVVKIPIADRSATSIASIASITGNRGGLDELYDRLAKGSEKDEATKAIEKQTKDIEEGNELQREGNRVLNQQNDILRGLKPGGQAVWGP